MAAVVGWLAVLLFLASSSDAKQKKKPSSCERLSISLCKGIGYEWTVFPNPLTRIPTQSITARLTTLYPYLAKFNCTTSDPLAFVCSVYAPKCFPKTRSHVIPPCREYCQQAVGKCPESLEMFDLSWPETLNCSKYPTAGGTRQCVNDNNMNVVKPSQRRVKHKKSRGKKANGNKLDQTCCRFGEKAAKKHLCSFSNLTSATGIQQSNFVKRVLEKCQEKETIFRSCCLNGGQKRGHKGRERKKELRRKNKQHKKNNKKMEKKSGRKPHKHHGKKKERKIKKIHG